MRLIYDQIEFFKAYKISIDEFVEHNLVWSDYIEIYEDYLNQISSLESTASSIADILRKNQDAHSVKSRVKDPEHLIEKILRKTFKNKKEDSSYQININNYKTEVTDLIGIRVLHLYKDQAFSIDKTIREMWDLHEKATIYYREGDFNSTTEDDELFQFSVHPAGYRSWHYLINSRLTRELHIVEIQVRTIFEEGWSEIDHQLRYPYDLDNEVLNEQLLVLNRISGGADELVNSILHTKMSITELNYENKKRENKIQELLDEISNLSVGREIDAADKKSLEDKVKQLEGTLSFNYLDYVRKGKNLIVTGNLQTSESSGISRLFNTSKVVFTPSPKE
ncbi:hypothetical protein [Gottfriedia solisilvae]|uniref:GTP pyrophosphokinase n=1 Tax=Gottfriedia solisilvae TaxID=1516104 RepID=A0A8J3AW53_9BACI|nr:hypothetical protein [Gottfriedia solisilvae]GGI17957.1 GTP pyrophosphokinase [Gottfriedia solisilvae]